MSGKDNDNEDITFDDDSSDDTLAETVVMSDDDDDDDISADDSTVEMDIERLVAKLETVDREDVHRRAEIRHRLEELRELREQELDSTFNFDLDDD
ncbi:MAG: hypothetical protein WBM87_04910 [Woeseiaceae bacterium]